MLADRIWIYQSNRDFTEKELALLEETGKHFVEQWTSHGAKMKAAVTIHYNRFVIIHADENQASASGCSIDASVRFIRQLEQQFLVSLLDRSRIAYRSSTGIDTFHFSEFDALWSDKILNKDTVIFNNLISAESQLQTEWEVPLGNTWLYKNSPVQA